jgi:hypothetical protein
LRSWRLGATNSSDPATLDAIKKNSPKTASADPASFIDTSIVDQLIKEGSFK